MDLGKIVDNEQLYSLELLHPDTYEPVGVTFKIRSMNSQAAQAVQRQIIDEIYELRQSNKRLKAKDTVANEYRKAAACVAGWDWGKNKYNGTIPEFNEVNVLKILKEQEWIFSQVTEATNNLANFLETSKTN